MLCRPLSGLNRTEGTVLGPWGRFAYQCVWSIWHGHAHVSAGSGGVLVPSRPLKEEEMRIKR
jgi:hypothetical protein